MGTWNCSQNPAYVYTTLLVEDLERKLYFVKRLSFFAKAIPSTFCHLKIYVIVSQCIEVNAVLNGIIIFTGETTLV